MKIISLKWSVCFGPGLSPYILYLTALLLPKYGETLKSILEDPDIPECAWDVRNDADALWALYKSVSLTLLIFIS